VNFVLALVVAIPVSSQGRNAGIFVMVLVLTVAFIAGVFLILHHRALALIKSILTRFGLAGIADKIGGFRAGIVVLAHSRGRMLQLLAVSLAYQSLGIVIVFMLGRALGLELGLWYYFIYLPVITALTVLPISLAGIGIREGAFVFFFAQAGVMQAQALALSLLLFAQTLALALLGGVWYFLARESPAAERASVPEKAH
jgi:hypothetical protein